MKILSLNLHSYQEEDQIEKFRKIAQKIVDLGVDVACFCEASQKLTNSTEKQIGEDNALKIICDYVNQNTKEQYQVKWEFSHYGFTVYEEGLGIISRLPVQSFQSRFVSKSKSPFDYRSRKILKAEILDDNQNVSVYVVHTNVDGDCYDPFQDQYEILKQWIDEDHNRNIILAGDFGIEPDGIMYENVSEIYNDFYIAANPEGLYDYTFINPRGLEFKNERKLRLDYIFGSNSFECVEAKRYFLDNDAVSDHAAVYCNITL